MRYRRRGFSDLTLRLGKMLDDTSGVRWSADEKKEALNLAILASWPRHHHIIDLLPLADYDRETFVYALPEGIEDVIALYFEPNNSNDPWWLVRQWHVDGDNIYIHGSYKDYDGQEIRAVCVRPAWEVNVNSVMGTDGITTIDTGTFTSATETFVAHTVNPGDTLWLYSGCDEADIKQWLIKTVDSETQVTVYGEFAASDTSITYYVNYFTYVPEMYLLHKAASELFQLSGHKGAGQDVSEDMQWAEFHAQMAEYYMGLQGKSYPSKRTA